MLPRPTKDGKYRCKRCDLWKPFDDFYRWFSKSKQRFMYMSQCKQCRRETKPSNEARRAYYYSTPEVRQKQITRSLEWIRKNPEKYKIIEKRYRDKKAAIAVDLKPVV